MISLLKSLYNRLENIKGRKLLILISVIFIVFFVVGTLIGYLNNRRLNNLEKQNGGEQQQEEVKIEEFQGKIKYINPQLYPDDNVSYTLIDGQGKTIILLSSVDQKLAVAENLNAKVVGRVVKSKDNTKDILMVERVTISNGSN